MKNLCIFDIETVPCVQTTCNLLNLDPQTSEDVVRQKLTEYHLEITKGQNSFPRQPFHKIVCISFLICGIELGDNGEEYSIKTLSTGGKNGEGEEEILTKFISFIQKYKPRLISFNGKTFDLPVIQYRSMKYAIPCPWLYSKELSYKFNHEPHCDLIDAFSNFGASARVKMSEVASLLGIPCKQSGSGNEVLSMYTAGKIKEICHYCEEDVLGTYMLYLHYQMHRGAIGQESFSIAIEQAREEMNQLYTLGKTI
ncbi:MAG: putative PolB exonuclease-like 3'-5' exonuclease [Candidatus Deianiraeaceae bacterium]|jgi:predicted PolB exonuclease-like 3'-5' exonuclease